MLALVVSQRVLTGLAIRTRIYRFDFAYHVDSAVAPDGVEINSTRRRPVMLGKIQRLTVLSGVDLRRRRWLLMLSTIVAAFRECQRRAETLSVDPRHRR